MIVSFHPCFTGDRNIICAGREPDAEDRRAIASADAVVLPQGCRQSLYEMARRHCPCVFPNYDVRFQYAGKLGDIALFEKEHLPHPKTTCYPTVKDMPGDERKRWANHVETAPFVFKLAWGGEGDTVFLIRSAEAFEATLHRAEQFEQSGLFGFQVQEYIPTDRSLRVVIIGKRLIAYWRVSTSPDGFGTSLAKGAVIDRDADPDLQREAIGRIQDFCKQTGINLAAFDAIVSNEDPTPSLLFLETNYFFGRRGLGGSESYYRLLEAEIVGWLDDIGLSVRSR